MKKYLRLFAFLLITSAPGAAYAAPEALSPAAGAYDEAMHQMHEKMMIEYSGDADKDFVRGMIPHHQGAVDMAKIQLKYGKDPELKKLAQDIIDSQRKEIKQMQQWQTIHDKAAK